MSYNKWIYGYSNPVKFTDPKGTDPIEDIAKQLIEETEACYNAGNFSCVWSNYYLLATGGKLAGYTHASEHLFRFLYKKGDVIYKPLQSNSQKYDSSWVQYSQTIQHELPNREKEIIDLIREKAKTGSTTGHLETSRSTVYVFDPNTEKDLYYAMNNFALWADFEFEIKGCYEVLVRPTYNFWDPYDWHPGLAAGGGAPGVAGFKDEWAASLDDKGLALEFEVSGYWYGPNKIYTFPSNWLQSNVPIPPINSKPAPLGRW